MLSPQINSFKKVVPIIYCYTTPGVTYHDGWCKIGESEQDSTSRVKQRDPDGQYPCEAGMDEKCGI